MPAKFDARKFVSFSDDSLKEEGSDISNSEHIVDQAAGLKSVSIVADKAAALARENLQKVRESLLQAPSQPAVNSSNIGNFSDSDVQIAQKSVSDQILQRLGESDTAIQTRLEKTALDIVRLGVSHVLPVRDQGTLASFNDVVPEIDNISVEVDRKKGTVDCFFSRITFNLPQFKLVQGKVKAIRVFRAEIFDENFSKTRAPLSIHGIDRIRSDRNRSRVKFDGQSAIENTLRENNVPNVLSDLIPVDPLLNVRTAASSQETTLNIPPSLRKDDTGLNQVLVDSFLSTEEFSHLDRSVLSDLLTMRNIQVQNPHLIPDKNSDLLVGNKSGDIRTKISINLNNSAGFKEIAFVTPEKLRSTTIGNLAQFQIEDETISYGKSYRYYLVSVDGSMRESIRSQIVQIDVDGLRIPDMPSRIYGRIVDNMILLNIGVEDQLVEKFEVFRKEAQEGLSKPEQRPVLLMSSDKGFLTDKVMRVTQDNQFIQVAEVLNNAGHSGANFFDRTVRPGRKYIYRIYSVDIFGNKSERPREIELFNPELQLKPSDLKKPTILVEVDSSTNKTKLTIHCDDKRVQSLFLGRRDLTIKQSAFVPPGQVSRIILGNADAAQGSRKFEDVHLVDFSKDNAWTGVFSNDGQQIIFVDQTVRFDHTYQYRVYGVDRFGNKTSFEYSRPIFVVRRPFVNAPVNVKAAVVEGTGGAIAGVRLTWDDGNIDISAEDRVGDREALRNSSVRTLFQVERRKIGEERWQEFPLVEGREFFDPVSSADHIAPAFRPDYLTLNERYVYRVEAFQTGAFISNFSSPVDVFVGHSVLPPENFVLRVGDTKVRPFFVMLNWSTDKFSGIIDRWEIERAEVNNFAAARLNIKNETDFSKLIWKPFRTVFKESSRFRSISIDDDSIPVLSGISNAPTDLSVDFRTFARTKESISTARPVALARGRGTIVDEHHFMDLDVVFGNTYFYRIRSVSPGGEKSSFVHRGMKITDSVFEKKLSFILTPEEVTELTNSFKPMTLKNSFESENSFSLQPSFVRDRS